MADTEVKLTLKSDADGVLSTLKDVTDAFGSVGGVVGEIGSLALQAAEKIKQLQNEVRQMREDFEQSSVSISKTANSLEAENLKLQDQIALLQHRPAKNQLAIALSEAAGHAQELTASLHDAITKERTLLEDKSVNFMRSLFSGQERTTDLSDEFAPELDKLAQILNEKQIRIAEFNLENAAVLQHGTTSQKRILEEQLQNLIKGYNEQLTTIGQGIKTRLTKVQDGLDKEKKLRIDDLTSEKTNVYGDGSFSVQGATSQAEAQKLVNEQYRTRQALIDPLRLSVLGLMQTETSEVANLTLRFKSAALQQTAQSQIVTIQARKSRLQAVHQANQEEVADYQQAFATINASAQQFNNQQLSILMTGINRNSAQIIQASQQRFKKLEQDEAASLERRRKAFDRVFQGISGSFTNFINGMMSGNQTLGQAWVKMVNDMATKFLSGLERQLMGYLEHKLMEVTIHASAEAAKNEASKATHAKEDKRTAYSAAKGAWESVVHTPIVGPILAPIAAAAAFAGVMAFGSAEGGQYIVPSEQLTMLHRNEMVLPAGVADRMRGVIESGGGRGVTVVVNHSVNAVDAESFQGHIRRHANLIGNEVARVLKRRGVVPA